MAIELVSTTKIRDDCYSVTVQDTATVIGQDDAGANIYKTYTLRHNPLQTAEQLKARFEKLISADQDNKSAIETVETAIKTTIESIDTVKLSVSKE